MAQWIEHLPGVQVMGSIPVRAADYFSLSGTVFMK